MSRENRRRWEEDEDEEEEDEQMKNRGECLGEVGEIKQMRRKKIRRKRNEAEDRRTYGSRRRMEQREWKRGGEKLDRKKKKDERIKSPREDQMGGMTKAGEEDRSQKGREDKKGQSERKSKAGRGNKRMRGNKS